MQGGQPRHFRRAHLGSSRLPALKNIPTLQPLPMSSEAVAIPRPSASSRSSMSSEAVAFPVGLVALPLIGAGFAVAAVVVPGTLAAKAIKSIVDARLERARRELEQEATQ